MPSEDMLAAAGLSAEDAQLLIAQLQTGGGGGTGGTGGNGNIETIYVGKDGTYWKKNAQGVLTQVQEKELTGKYNFDTSMKDNLVSAQTSFSNLSSQIKDTKDKSGMTNEDYMKALKKLINGNG